MRHQFVVGYGAMSWWGNGTADVGFRRTIWKEVQPHQILSIRASI